MAVTGMALSSHGQNDWISISNFPGWSGWVEYSPLLTTRLMSLSIKDNRGLVVDSVDIEIDDADGRVNIPPKGAIIQVWLGWSNTGLFDKGNYKVDSTSHRGAPDVLSISAMANDVSEGLKQKRERSWSNHNNSGNIWKSRGRIWIKDHCSWKVCFQKKSNTLPRMNLMQTWLPGLQMNRTQLPPIKNGHLIFVATWCQSNSFWSEPCHVCNSTGTREISTTTPMAPEQTMLLGSKPIITQTTKPRKLHVVVGDTEDNMKEIRYVHRDKTTAELAANAEYNRCKRTARKLTYTSGPWWSNA